MAIMMGGTNIGHTVGKFFGAFLFEQSAVLPNGSLQESSEFQNLWIGAFLQGFLSLPFVVLAAPFMLPDAKQTEVLLGGEHQRESGAGSLLSRGSSDV